MNPLDIITAPCWLTPEGQQSMESRYALFLKDQKSYIEAYEARLIQLNSDIPGQDYEVINGNAIIYMTGLLMPQLDFFAFLFGGTSTDEMQKQVNQAADDPSVEEIFIISDTPGGVVYGIQETAEVVFEARNKKPITTFVKGIMASGGTYIGTAASKVYVSGDLVDVGHIGVRTQHTDLSALQAKIGVKVTDMSEGEFKDLRTPNRPMTLPEQIEVQNSLKYSYDIFTRDVAKYRGMTQEQIVDMGARVFQGQQAIDIGLVDGIASFDDLINKKSGNNQTIRKFVSKNSKEEITMDSRELKDKHPDTYAAIISEGKALGIEVGRTEAQADIDAKVVAAKAEGITEGAANEVTRIKEVQAVSIPGHEKLIQELIDDGKTTGAQAAVKVIAAQKVLLETKAKNFDEDGKEIKVPHNASKDDGEAKKDFMVLVAEYKAEKNCSQGEAVKAVAKANPEAHEKYVADLKAK